MNLVLSVGLMICACCLSLHAQPAVLVEDLLADADSAYAEAVAAELLIWSPRRMGQAEESIRSARSQIKNPANETITRLNLESALESIETASTHAATLRSRIQSVVDTRAAARSVGANNDLPAWQQAERALAEMAAKIEAGDEAEVNGLQEMVAQQYYTARRDALRSGVLSQARDALAAAQAAGADVQFPTIYTRAQQALSRAEAALAQENMDDSRVAAAEAVRLARHASGQSAFVRRAQNTRMPYESLLLPYDNLLAQIAADWGDSLAFSEGGDAAVEEFQQIYDRRQTRESAIQDSVDYVLNTARQSMERTLSEMQTSLADQQDRIAELDQRNLDMQAERDVAVNRLRKRELTAQRVQMAQTAFDAGDAVVYQSIDGHIVIHLYGVKFASGKATIGKDQQSIVKKAADAISVFPDVAGVIVEGHTDAEGSEESNHELSEQRAAAVGEALAGVLKPGVSVTTVGKGETAPIASNESARGRTLNRRIDLVIMLP